MTFKLAAIVLASVVALPGWGGDDREGSGADARAERIVLRETDLPSGWRAQPGDDDPEADIDLEMLSACDDAAAAEDDAQQPSGSAKSASFESRSQRRFASGAVSVYAQTAAATEAFDLASGGCLAQILADAMRQAEPTADSEIGNVDVEPLAAPDLGDEADAGRVRVEIRFVEGGSLDWIFDVVMVREGDALTSLVTSGLGEPLPAARRDRILGRVVERME